MTNDERMTNSEDRIGILFSRDSKRSAKSRNHSSFVIDSSFVIGLPQRSEQISFQPRRETTALVAAEALAEFVPFFAGHFEVEHHVFDVQTQLREGLLH